MSNITERSKERRKTRQALAMVRAELDDHLNDLVGREERIDRQLLMYTSLTNPESVLEDMNVDSLIAYKSIFTSLYLSDNIHTSLQMAEMSGALGNVKNLHIVEAIYASYAYCDLIVRIEKGNERQKNEYFNKQNNK